jgi:two-component system, cell cycle response regulator
MCTSSMALRVLLADESSTIKKVLQLALQDFAVEVKAVPIGLDVLQVAKSFKPEIIFVDVLLQKRNGYEVAGDIKNDRELKDTPVVLMWSGFMEIDEAKAKASKVDRRLEKPFDAETLRGLVKDLVPKTNSNLIASYLSFPELPNMVDDPKQNQAPKFTPPEMGDADEPEEFQNVPLPSAKSPSQYAPMGGAEAWAHQDLSRFKIELPKDDVFEAISDLTGSSIAISSGTDNEDQSMINVSLDEIDSFSGELTPPPKAQKAPILPGRAEQTAGAYTGTNLNSVAPNTAEQVLREEARAVLESVAWKIIPEIVERVVREELQKLLKDAERL